MTRKADSRLVSGIAACLFMLASCVHHVVYTDTVSMKNRWDMDSVIYFSMNNTDTVSSVDISFIIRTGSDYPFRNIYLFVSITSPDGKVLTDTLEYYLADESGRRYGRGTGEIREVALPFKTNVYFSKKGSYNFSVCHGMRMTDLPGVHDFGIKVVNDEKQQHLWVRTN